MNTTSSVEEWWPGIGLTQGNNSLKVKAHRLASYLTNPLFKAHELFRRIYLVETLNPTASAIQKFAIKFFLALGLIACAATAMLTTLPGGIVRGIAVFLEKELFTYFKGEAPEQPFKDNFSMLSWNICCIGGGYAISDGGVMPWQYRLPKIAAKIEETRADVVCLQEVFDMDASLALCEKLKNTYAHFYINIGPGVLGPSSGLFIASKFPLQSPEFAAFPKGTVTGRAQGANKGVFSFGIGNQVRVYNTHLQHSEEPTDPEIDVGPRNQQMHFIMDKVAQVQDRAVVVTGDLNLEDQEYARSSWSASFERAKIPGDKKTWGGDEFCAKLVDPSKKVSPPLNLDYTLVQRASIKTSLVDTGFDGRLFREAALSDHSGLLSRIGLR